MGVFAVLAALALTAAGAGDILQQLEVAKADATQHVISAFAHGSVDYWSVRNAFKAAPAATRAALVEQVLVWTKAYVNSPQFAKDYAAYREQAKPQPEEGVPTSVDEELKARKAKQKADLEEMKKSIAAMPAQYRKDAEAGYKAAVEAMNQMDTPELRAMERQGIEMEMQEAIDRQKEALARWQQEYPADPRALVKKRLTEFLQRTAGVDYAARLVNSGGKMRFANAAYEGKPDEWKLAFRAGKETTEKARAFAQGWLGELK
jgi:hypothetical protein